MSIYYYIKQPPPLLFYPGLGQYLPADMDPDAPRSTQAPPLQDINPPPPAFSYQWRGLFTPEEQQRYAGSFAPPPPMQQAGGGSGWMLLGLGALLLLLSAGKATGRGRQRIGRKKR